VSQPSILPMGYALMFDLVDEVSYPPVSPANPQREANDD
jgi:hypothetical protein